MDLKTVMSCAELILAVGEDPDGTPRHYATVRKNVDSSRLARLKRMEEAGIIEGIPGTFCGRPVTRYRLTERGELVRSLLSAIERV